MCRQASEATSPELLESPPPWYTDVPWRTFTHFVSLAPEQTISNSDGNICEQSWETRPGDLSVTPASLRKTRASRLCVKNKSWHCRRTVQHPPPPCSNRLTRHDCPSTGHVNQRLMQHSNADDSQASTENVWTPSCQISHERHKDEISRRGVEF